MSKRDKFLTTEVSRVLRVVDENPFALLVPVGSGEPCPVHLPLVVSRRTDGIQLSGHIASEHPAVEQLSGPVLATFSGPHAYVSARWYSSNNRVPTWNYVAAYCWGELRFVADPVAADEAMRLMVATFEGQSEQAWSIEKLPEKGYARRLPMIRPFTIEVRRAEALYKLSQDKKQAERDEVILGLREAGEQALVREMLSEVANPDEA